MGFRYCFVLNPWACHWQRDKVVLAGSCWANLQPPGSKMSHVCPRSTLPAAAPPLEDDDLLSEILIRLPPQPSSLPRVSAVCKRWCGLVSDPGFARRFRRRNPPPLLGFFGQGFDGIDFQPTMDPPNCIPSGRFSMLLDGRFRPKLLGCRHGLVLVLDKKLKQVVVWDPFSGDRHSLAVPPRFDASIAPIVGSVLRPVGDAHHFQVILAGSHKIQQHTQAFACIYSSKTSVWSGVISTLLPSMDYRSSRPFMFFSTMPAVLAGDSLYWTLTGISPVILQFDLHRRSLAVIHLPADTFAPSKQFTVMQADGGGLGLLSVSGLTAQLWRRNTDSDGVASWVLGRTIELDKLLFQNSEVHKHSLVITGFAERNNVVFMYTLMGLFMLQLESLQFKKCSEPSMLSCYHPFEGVYAADK
ncbi:hypothetical protein QYE76_049697 [Lolium multiflorum]|uniref:F-box domain-containing protein n=1 Tax=Lolium multiflorum TaxID=4521 RepID=A0AAD8WIK1_LOLMU|nr:hypothetical protein QYE76_049697 [Lolium multiflorum]